MVSFRDRILLRDYFPHLTLDCRIETSVKASRITQIYVAKKLVLIFKLQPVYIYLFSIDVSILLKLQDVNLIGEGCTIFFDTSKPDPALTVQDSGN